MIIGPTLNNLGTLIVAEEAPNITGIPTVHPACDPDNHDGGYHCIGRVWILYSTPNNITQWGTISSLGIDHSAKRVMCHQLGYSISQNDSFMPPILVDNTPPIWLTDVSNCGDGDSNILQCNHRLCEFGDDCYDHMKDLIISCGESLVSVIIMW